MGTEETRRNSMTEEEYNFDEEYEKLFNDFFGHAFERVDSEKTQKMIKEANMYRTYSDLLSSLDSLEKSFNIFTLPDNPLTI
jgi:phosphoglucomutase